jgi:hypothetical protein
MAEPSSETDVDVAASYRTNAAYAAAVGRAFDGNWQISATNLDYESTGC